MANTSIKNQIKIIKGDCLKILDTIKESSIDIIITSPPYNLNIKYNAYKDNKKRQDYLNTLNQIFSKLKSVLKENGSFFLNIGHSSKDPWVSIDVINECRSKFILQNKFVWVKSIAIENNTFGHFKPINSDRYVNITTEDIYHLTKKDDTKINKNAIGVPYKYKSNIARYNHKEDRHCRGNAWFIPYKTIQNKLEKGKHPAIFPEKLVENCLLLHGNLDKNTVSLDPYAGTGTVAVVSKKLGIKNISIEIDEEYIKFIENRLNE